jgi:hypothetical protein
LDTNLKEYLNSGKHLPDFLRDFHDQKLFFKRLDEINQNRKDKYTENVNWISGQCYTIDVFLWFMAAHGYTLQKSRKQVPFYDINHDLSIFEEKQREASANMIKQIFNQKNADSDKEKE